MKYLFLIIRHLFPRRRWVQVSKDSVNDVEGRLVGYIVTMRDQFGNIKTHQICGNDLR